LSLASSTGATHTTYALTRAPNLNDAQSFAASEREWLGDHANPP
jgi:hypothetical protein